MIALEQKWREIGVSPSRLLRFLECRQKEKLDQEGWRSRMRRDAMEYGTLGHEAVEAVYRTHRHGEDELLEDLTDIYAVREFIEKWLGEYRAVQLSAGKWNDSLAQNWELWEVFLLATLPRYFNHWGDDENQRIWVDEGLEAKARVPFHGTWLNGRLDYVFRLPSRRKRKKHPLWIMDSKFPGRVEDATLEETLGTDFQMLFYLLSAKLKWGELPKGCLYNIIRRPGQKLKKGEKLLELQERLEYEVIAKPEHYFKRFEIPAELETIDAFERDLMEIIDEFFRWLSQDRPVRLHGNPCRGKFGPCEYYQFCHLDNKALYKQEKRDGSREEDPKIKARSFIKKAKRSGSECCTAN